MKITYSFDQIQNAVQQLIDTIKDTKIVTFTGMLGAGKTTIIRELLREWNITQGVTSPTFTYMNQYVTPEGLKIFHFDLYRIASVDEFIALGFDEYLHKENSVVLIEWPEVIKSLLDSLSVCHVKLEYDEADSMRRIMTMQ